MSSLEKGLYIVSTPIGNLEDITLRAVNTLKNSDYILCEDTRVSKILFDRYQIKSKLISNHKFNEKKNLSKIIKLLKLGSKISLVSDAGTPSISDPGALLIRECVNNNIQILPIPGPSAVSTVVATTMLQRIAGSQWWPETSARALCADNQATSQPIVRRDPEPTRWRPILL